MSHPNSQQDIIKRTKKDRHACTRVVRLRALCVPPLSVQYVFSVVVGWVCCPKGVHVVVCMPSGSKAASSVHVDYCIWLLLLGGLSKDRLLGGLRLFFD